MTLDIIKPKPSILDVDNQMVQEGIDALVAGIVAGTVLDLHSAVECVNAALNKHFSGNVVEPYANALYAELKEFDAKADELAREGKTISQIVAALQGYEDHFTIADLQMMKVEVYGSVAEWQAAMTNSEA